MAGLGASRPLPCVPAKGRLTQPVAGTQPWRREQVFMPHNRHLGRHIQATAPVGTADIRTGILSKAKRLLRRCRARRGKS